MVGWGPRERKGASPGRSVRRVGGAKTGSGGQARAPSSRPRLCNVGISEIDSNSFRYADTGDRGINRFNPRPPVSGRPAVLGALGLEALFQSTPARERATGSRGGRGIVAHSFNPRPPVSGRLHEDWIPLFAGKFQSTPARERATLELPIYDAKTMFQSTPARERATRTCHVLSDRQGVSIHARP